MSSPLIRNMLAQYAYPVLDATSIDEFVQRNDYSLLFFAGNPKQYPESDDVAMILPELIKAFDHQLGAALIDPQAETELRARYAFSTWPALVFLRKGQYLGAITRVQNWEDYLGTIRRLLDTEPARMPALGIPVVSEPPGVAS